MDDFLKNAGQSADFAVGIDVDGDIHSAGQPQAALLQISGGGFCKPRFPLSDSVHIWLKVLNIMYIRDTIFKNLYFLMVKRHFVSGRGRVIGKERDMQRMLTAFCKAKGHLAFWTEQRQRGGSANGLTGSGT